MDDIIVTSRAAPRHLSNGRHAGGSAAGLPDAGVGVAYSLGIGARVGARRYGAVLGMRLLAAAAATRYANAFAAPSSSKKGWLSAALALMRLLGS